MQEQSQVGDPEAQTKPSAEGSVDTDTDEDDEDDDFGFPIYADITNNP
eukprot:CAMPEP_0201638536 /NCGR_PEP_ID=MMETSP0493-20130528/16838_1 /ASSEMBLY_ACC=CAM_ASM_000838 /TAXON_ID=420259 /ORGANISM="Thalassiosira gravida, Strain GMp14c1" /LENGTH=47 /DNA_ID= /DNA_START= /DNA_END= /DNA_ORIENTATION=